MVPVEILREKMVIKVWNNNDKGHGKVKAILKMYVTMPETPTIVDRDPVQKARFT